MFSWNFAEFGTGRYWLRGTKTAYFGWIQMAVLYVHMILPWNKWLRLVL